MTKLAELDIKLQRVRRWLCEQSAAGLLLCRRSNFAWITCGGQSHVNTFADMGAAAVLITPQRQFLIANNIEIQRLAAEQTAELPFELADFPWHDPSQEARLVKKIVGDGRLAADAGPADLPADDAVKTMRASLTPAEVDRYVELGRFTTRALEDVCRRIEPGWTEHRAASEVFHLAVESGARVPVCLIAGDDRIERCRHPVLTDTSINKRAMVVMCIEQHGLVCSATRLISFVPLDDELRRRHRAVCGIDADAIMGTRVGRSFKDIFADITAAYARVGYPDQWREHHQGGSTGYQPRDVVANSDATATVHPHQAFAWNPSITGTKSEDTIIVTDDGWRWITEPGENWPIVEIEREGKQLRRADILVRAV